MYCPKCGKENADGASFCQSCGSSFAAPAQPVAPSPPAYQAAPYQAAPQGSVPKIPNHLGWSIVSIFLFWPTAIAAIVNSTRVDSLAIMGDVPGAQLASAKALKFCKISTWIFGVYIAIYILAMIIIAVVAN
jgi:hypothetical protein